MKFKVLVSAPYLLPVLDQYRQILEENNCDVLVASGNERLEESDLLPLVGDVDGVICGDDKFTPRVIEAAPRLKVLSKWGTGIDSLDQQACARRGILIKNVPNAFSEPVADTVIGWMLCFARRLPDQTATMRDGKWVKLSGHALNEKTLGVVGIGDTGKAVVRRATAFGMKVRGYDIGEVDRQFVKTNKLELTDLKGLLKESDYISLNCTLTADTKWMINEASLSLMKDGAIILNAARGPLIRESDLISALESGKLGGAALDVFEEEPLSASSKLRQLPNLLLSAHNANSSPLAWNNVHEQAISNLLEGLSKAV